MGADRSKWPAGPWDGEPDHVEFEHAGLPCLLHRGPSGAWCGYVAVAPGHPAHGTPYMDVDVSVHGGLTYGAACQGSICHVPKPGEPDNVWWLGFDCVHDGDQAPGHLALNGLLWSGGTYRTMEYARRETEYLARQLAEMEARRG